MEEYSNAICVTLAGALKKSDDFGFDFNAETIGINCGYVIAADSKAAKNAFPGNCFSGDKY